MAELDDGRDLKFGRAAMNDATTIDDRLRLTSQNECKRAPGITNVQGFKVHIQNEHRPIQQAIFAHDARSIPETSDDRQSPGVNSRLAMGLPENRPACGPKMLRADGHLLALLS